MTPLFYQTNVCPPWPKTLPAPLAVCLFTSRDYLDVFGWMCSVTCA